MNQKSNLQFVQLKDYDLCLLHLPLYINAMFGLLLSVFLSWALNIYNPIKIINF